MWDLIPKNMIKNGRGDICSKFTK